MSDRLRPLLPALLAAAFAVLLMLPGALTAALHCDETNVFRHATDFARGHFGTPGRPGLLWLALAPLTALGDPVVATHAMRLTAVLASAATVFGVYRLTELALRRRDEQEDPPGLLRWAPPAAAGLLLTSMSWQAHSFEVRTDTYVVPLTLLSLGLLLRERISPRAAAGAGLAMAAAGLVSQKSVYIAAATGGAFVLHRLLARPGELREGVRAAATAFGAGAAALVAWYGGMSLLNPDFLADNLHTAVKTGLSEVWSLDQNLATLVKSAESGRALWGLAALGLPVAVFQGRRRPRLLALTAVAAAMCATLFVHRGFRAYFVASFEPYLAVPAGATLGFVAAALHRVRRPLAALTVAGVLAWSAWQARDEAAAMLSVGNHEQLRLMADIEEAFPEPVPFWDSVGLVPGYPETTFFGTGPTRTAKRRASRGGGPMYVTLARQNKPRFFIRDYMTRDQYLEPIERRWHWRHFVPYRDNLYLLGGRIAVYGDGEERGEPIEVLVPGPYTVRVTGGWVGEARVDGRLVADGEVVELSEGKVHLAARSTAGDGRLALLIGRNRTGLPEGSEDHVDWSLYPRLRRDRYQRYDGRGRPADLLTQPGDGLDEKAWKARRARHARWRAEWEATNASPRPPARTE